MVLTFIDNISSSRSFELFYYLTKTPGPEDWSGGMPSIGILGGDGPLLLL
jgi:hypothetical protein